MAGIGCRATGEGLAITLWASEETLRASEAEAARLRQQAAQATAAVVSGVEHYEVAVRT